MKKLYLIKRNLETPENRKFWETLEKSVEEARKLPEWMNPWRGPPPSRFINYKNIKFLSSVRIRKANKDLAELEKEIKALQEKKRELQELKKQAIDKITIKCSHEMCLQWTDWSTDEYGQDVDGPTYRKCISCFLEEEESCREKINYLKKSEIVRIKKVIGDEEFEIEHFDLKL